MHPIITARHGEIVDLCQHHRVTRLDVFGSAATDEFHPDRSDLDFLVEFEEMTPVAYKRAYFGLLWGLEAIFARNIDIVTAPSLKNPHFVQNVYATRKLVYGG